MNNTEKIYAGSAKIVQTNYGEMTKISLHKEDVNKIVKYMKDNGLDWCNLDVKGKQSPQEGKPTHYLEINTWKPDSQPQQSKPTTTMAQDMENDEDTLPF